MAIRRSRLGGLVLAIIIAVVAVTPVLAGGRGGTTTYRFTFDESSVEFGCRSDAVLVRRTGTILIHLTAPDVPGGPWSFSGNWVMNIAWAEDSDGDPSTPDELFVGREAAPIGIQESPGGAITETGVYSVTFRGDQGSRGRVAAVYHLTVGPDGELTLFFDRGRFECR